MKINQYMLNTLKLDESNFLNKYSVFKGKIIDIFGSKVLLEVKGKSIIPAILDTDVKVSIGDEMMFLVKSSSKSEILIKAIDNAELQEFKNSTSNKADDSISKLLKTMNIEVNKTSLDIVKNLIKSNIALNRENINNSIKILEKVVQLNSLADDEKVLVLSGPKGEDMSENTKDFQSNNSEDIKDLKPDLEIKNPDNHMVSKKLQLNSNTMKTNIATNSEEIEKENASSANLADKVITLKSDLKNMVIIKENIDFNEKDISLNIKNILSENKHINLRENLPKLITLFIKNDIKPNLNNIINMQELNQDPELFIEKWGKLNSLIKSEIGEKEFKNLFISEEKINIENSKNIKTEISQIENILEKAKAYGKFSMDKELIELKHKNDFLTDINKNLLFTLIPISHKKYDLNGLVNFIKKNKKKSYKEKTNVFINLNTNNLDNIKVSCHFSNDNISIKMGMKKQYLNLFERNENLLIEKITNLGYKVKSIHYALEEEVDIIDTINGGSKLSSTYYLDVKV